MRVSSIVCSWLGCENMAKNINVDKNLEIKEYLLKSESRFRNIVETTSDWIWEIDLEGHHVYSNYMMEKILGYSAKEVCEVDIMELVHPDDKKVYKKKYAKAIRSKSGWKGVVMRFRSKDGRYRFFESSAVPKFDFDGEVIGFVGIDRDITERIEREKEKENTLFSFKERVKELECFYGLADLVEKEGIELFDICRGLIDLVPPGWQFPSITCCQITVNDFVCATDNFEETEWKMTAKIFVKGKECGAIDVCYLEGKPERDEGPFLEEERRLINALSERLGRIIEHKKTETAMDEYRNALERKNEVLREVLEQITIEKKKIMDNVVVNAENLLLPLVSKLRAKGASKKYADLLKKNIHEITLPFGRKLVEKSNQLSFREIEVSNMIRNGMTSKEIASALNLSVRGIEKYRYTLRKKLELTGEKINLTSYLMRI